MCPHNVLDRVKLLLKLLHHDSLFTETLVRDQAHSSVGKRAQNIRFLGVPHNSLNSNVLFRQLNHLQILLHEACVLHRSQVPHVFVSLDRESSLRVACIEQVRLLRLHIIKLNEAGVEADRHHVGLAGRLPQDSGYICGGERHLVHEFARQVDRFHFAVRLDHHEHIVVRLVPLDVHGVRVKLHFEFDLFALDVPHHHFFVQARLRKISLPVRLPAKCSDVGACFGQDLLQLQRFQVINVHCNSGGKCEVRRGTCKNLVFPVLAARDCHILQRSWF